MAKPSEQLSGYFQRKAANLEEIADHHASTGEPSQAKELYKQARDMYARLGAADAINRIDGKLKKLK
jgi:plasmid stabilization system protein ParE